MTFDLVFEDQERERESKVADKLRMAQSMLSESPYFLELKTNLASEPWLQATGHKVSALICYGIGSFSLSGISRYQLALLVLLKDWLGCDSVSVFDPILTPTERGVLTNILGMAVIGENEVCRRRLNPGERVLFYMPHMERSFYNNLMWANWGLDMMSNLSILGNSFRVMTDILSSKRKACSKEYAYVFSAVDMDIVKETEFNNCFKFEDVFNDISFHTFDISRIDSKAFDGVYSQDAPVYSEEDVF